MRPKRKLMQKQSARIVLRHNDHRDVIIKDSISNDMVYHNITFLCDRNSNLKLVWYKFPYKALICGINVQSSGGAIAHTIFIDIERHMIYDICSNAYADNIFNTVRLKDFAINYINSGSMVTEYTKFMASKNGVVFHKNDEVQQSGFSLQSYAPKPLGNGNTLAIHRYTSNATDGILYKYDFSLNDEEEDDELLQELSVVAETFNLTFQESSPVSYFLGNTESGVLIARRRTETNIDYGVFYHVSSNGYVNEVFNWKAMSPNHIGYDNYNYLINNTAHRDCMVKVGTDYFIANIWHDVSASTESSHKEWWRVLYCNGDLTDWKIAPLDYFFTPQIGEIGRMVVFARGNRVYAFCGTQSQEKRVRLFCTDNHVDWFELNLPPYKDIPLEEYGGNTVAIPTGGYSYVRVKFDPSAESASDGYNVNMWDGLDGYFFQYGQYGFFMSEFINTDSEQEFGLAVQIGRILIYTPTINFLPNDNMQAFYIGSNGDGKAYDFVINGDYVLGSQVTPAQPGQTD